MEGGVVDRCREVFVLPTFGARGGRIFFWRAHHRRFGYARIELSYREGGDLI